MADSTDSDHTFEIKLFQVARTHTETFTVQAKDVEAAQTEADKIIKTKDLDPTIKAGQVGAVDVEITDVTVEEQQRQAAEQDRADTQTTTQGPAPEPEAR